MLLTKPSQYTSVVRQKKAASLARKEQLTRYARSAGLVPEEVAVGLERALWEAGPNPVTDFADALQFEGKRPMPPKERAQWEALRRFRVSLTLFLAGRNAAFIGGVAVRSYGGRLSATIDYDLLIEADLLKVATAFLEKQGGALKGSVEDTYTFHLEPCALSFDLRVARSSLDRAALATARSASFMGHRLKLVRPDYLAAMKVKAYSDRKHSEEGRRDRLDVKGLIDCTATTADEIREVLKRHRADLLQDLDEILS